jgi:ribonuclease HI
MNEKEILKALANILRESGYQVTLDPFQGEAQGDYEKRGSAWADNHITVGTDGACSGNPGPGGWGVAIEWHDDERDYLNGGALGTTNNKMELLAAIKALEYASDCAASITLFTDSQYVMHGITEWITRWKGNGWRTTAKKPVKNKEYWERLDELNAAVDVTWQWVAKEDSNPLVEEAHKLAQEGKMAK